MKGPQGTQWRCRERPGRAPRMGESRLAQGVMLVPFSTRLLVAVLDRLRVVAPQLGLRQGEITAAALRAFVSREGF